MNDFCSFGCDVFCLIHPLIPTISRASQALQRNCQRDFCLFSRVRFCSLLDLTQTSFAPAQRWCLLWAACLLRAWDLCEYLWKRKLPASARKSFLFPFSDPWRLSALKSLLGKSLSAVTSPSDTCNYLLKFSQVIAARWWRGVVRYQVMLSQLYYAGGQVRRS